MIDDAKIRSLNAANLRTEKKSFFCKKEKRALIPYSYEHK
jgi:hypothetical protein